MLTANALQTYRGPIAQKEACARATFPSPDSPVSYLGKKDDGDIQLSSCYEDHPAFVPLLTSNWLNQPANWISLCPKHQEICHKLKGLDPKIDDPVLAS